MLIPLETLDFSLPDIRKIAPPPRADEALRESIRARGLLQAILVRPAGNAHQVVLGRRRARAMMALGAKAIEAECRPMSDLEALEAQVIENLQRQQMHVVDQWRATKSLLDAGASIEDAAMAVGLDARATQRMVRLASLHPKLQALVEADMPSTQLLAAIASAPPDRQADALKVPHALPKGDSPNWHVIASACRRASIPRGHAIFDTGTAGIVFEEDLFAEPGALDQFVTHDTTGFMAAQTAALAARVEAARLRGERVQHAEWSQHDIAVPRGWTRRWTEPPKTPPKGKSGPILLMAVDQRADSYGEIMQVMADPPAGTPTRAMPAAAPAPKRRTETTIRHDATIDPAVLTRRGQQIIAAAKTEAIREHLRNPPGAQSLPLLARCLVLTLAAGNVRVSGETKWSHVDFADLVPRLVDQAGHMIELPDAELLGLLGEALARILVLRDPAEGEGSGVIAEYIGHALDVPLPRFDTEAFLATLQGEELRQIARRHDPPFSLPGTVAALRQQLVGSLPTWRPAAFGAPGPKPRPAGRSRVRTPEMEEASA